MNPHTRFRPALAQLATLAAALVFVRFAVPAWCSRDADRWFAGDPTVVHKLCATQVAFEADDAAELENRALSSKNRFAGEWALVTHQMTALGLGQAILAHPEWKLEFEEPMRRAALRSFAPEMRDFGTRAWRGEDALASLESSHGHAYLAYSALALGMARLVAPEGLTPPTIQMHDALIATYERRLLAEPTGLIETYPGHAFPTDVAAVAAAIALHGRAAHVDHSKVLAQWVHGVRTFQIDPQSGFVHQQMTVDGELLDVPRGSGTGLAAYYAAFVDDALARDLARALGDHERSFMGFSGIAEFDRHQGSGDIDSGPVVLGVSIAATGFSLAPLRAGYRDVDHDTFVRIFRTTDLFGLTWDGSDRYRFRSGGPFGNALLLAMLTANPQLVHEARQ